MLKYILFFFPFALFAQENTPYQVAHDTVNSLQEIVILAEKNVQKQTNKLLYKPQKSILTQQAKGDQVLKSIPLLHSKGDQYLYQGKQTKVFINGNEDLGGNLIKQIPKEAIQSIEVIPNGGAEYSMTEDIAIIHIKLFPDYTDSFFQELQMDLGGLNENTSVASSSIMSGGRWLVHLPIRYNQSQQKMEQEISEKTQESEAQLESKRRNTNLSVLPSFNLNLANTTLATTAYYLNQKQKNTILDQQTTSQTTSLYALSSTLNHELKPKQHIQVKGVLIKHNLDYTENQENSVVSNTTVAVKTEFTSQRDTLFHQPLDYALGYQGESSNTRFLDETNQEDKRYKNQFFVSSSWTFLKKIKLYTNLTSTLYSQPAPKTKTHFFFLPTASLSYDRKAYSFSLAYTHRVLVPTYQQLDERAQTKDGYFYTKGNLNLQPERKHTITLDVTKQVINSNSFLNWQTALNYTNEAIVLQSSINPTGKSVLTQYVNGGEKKSYTSGLSLFTVLHESLLIQLTYTLSYVIHNQEPKGYTTAYSLYTKYKFNTKLFVEFQSSYTSREYDLNYTTLSYAPSVYFNLNYAISKAFSLEFSATNPFGWGNKQRITYYKGESVLESEKNNKMSNLFLTLSYRFGKEKNITKSSYE